MMLSLNNPIVSRETSGPELLPASSILRRTRSCAAEIRQTTHELTQGERLVLVLVDGAISRDKLRRRLSGLSDARFERALSGLVTTGLIEEVVRSVDDIEWERLGVVGVEVLLRPDSCDPVTMPFPDSDTNASPAITSSALDAKYPATIELDGVKSALKRGVVDFYLPLETAGTQMPTQAEVEFLVQSQRLSPIVPTHGRRRDDGALAARKGIESTYWSHKGHWFMFIGLASAMLLLVIRASH